jgi:hypothetical protein
MTQQQVNELEASGRQVSAVPTPDGNFRVTSVRTGTPQMGFEMTYDEKGRPILKQSATGIGATDRFARASKEAEKQKLQSADRNTQDLMEVKRRYSSVMQSKGILPAAARKLESITPGTELHAIQKDIIDPFKKRLGLEQITQLRQASPSGASVGNPTDADGQRLESAFGSLDPTASPAIFNRNINRAIESYLDVIHGTPEQRDKLMEEGKITAKQNAEIEAQYPSSTMDIMGIEQPRQTGGTGNPAIDEIIQRNNIQIK